MKNESCQKESKSNFFKSTIFRKWQIFAQYDQTDEQAAQTSNDPLDVPKMSVWFSNIIDLFCVQKVKTVKNVFFSHLSP
jgi:hypothetical protein